MEREDILLAFIEQHPDHITHMLRETPDGYELLTEEGDHCFAVVETEEGISFEERDPRGRRWVASREMTICTKCREPQHVSMCGTAIPAALYAKLVQADPSKLTPKDLKAIRAELERDKR